VRWGPIIGVGAVSLAAFLLYRTLGDYSFDQLTASVRQVPVTRLLLALGFAGASYLCLGLFDFFGLRYAGRPLAWRQAALASFSALSIGHNLGFAALSSGAVRYRFYRRWGLSREEVARVIVFCGTTVGLGLAALGGLTFLLQTDLADTVTGLSDGLVRLAGAGLLLACAGYVLASARVNRPLQLWQWTFRLPDWRLGLAQLVIGPVNFALVAACLHQAIVATAEISYFVSASAYVLANTAVLLAHVPGGLGVIEAVVMQVVSHADIIGGLLVFRFCYFLVPLVVGGATFGVSEIYFSRISRHVGRTGLASKPAKHMPGIEEEGAGQEPGRTAVIE